MLSDREAAERRLSQLAAVEGLKHLIGAIDHEAGTSTSASGSSSSAEPSSDVK